VPHVPQPDRADPAGRYRYVSLCPELDIASQGDTVEAARDNLREAVELFFEAAGPGDLDQRRGREVFVTRLEVAGG